MQILLDVHTLVVLLVVYTKKKRIKTVFQSYFENLKVFEFSIKTDGLKAAEKRLNTNFTCFLRLDQNLKVSLESKKRLQNVFYEFFEILSD